MRSSAARPTALAVVMALLVGLLSLVGFAAPASAAPATASVTVKAGTQLVSQLQVDVLEWDGDSYQLFQSGTTNSAGKASFTGLTVGKKYQAVARSSDAANFGALDYRDYADTFLGATARYSSAAAGFFTATATTSKAISLLAGYTISGELLDPNGDAIEPTLSFFKEVSLWQKRDGGFDKVSSTQSPLDGSGYAIDSLAPGSYYAFYEPLPTTGWAPSWSGNVASRDDATPIVVGSADVSADARFLGAGSVTGTLSLAGGASLAGTSGGTVVLFAYRGGVESYRFGEVQADPATGAFQITGVPEGSYTLLATTGDDESIYYPEYFNNAATAAASAPISVWAGQSTPADIELGEGFTLSGTVQSGGQPLAGVSVDARVAGGLATAARHAETDEFGNYTIDNVAPGAYSVEFTRLGDDYETRYATSASGSGSTDSFAAAKFLGASDALDVDLDFPIASSYVVSVTTAAGAPFRGVLAFDHIVNGSVDPAGTVYGLEDFSKPGTFLVEGLTAGDSYAPYVSFDSERINDQYLGGANFAAESDLVVANPGESTLQFSLASTVSIGGKVTNAAGVAVRNATIFVYGFDGTDWSLVGQTFCGQCGVPSTTSAAGTYSIPNLQPGSYKVRVAAPLGNPGYGGWFGGTSLETATPLYIGPGGTAVVNYKLTTGGAVSGTITGAVTGTPFGSAALSVFRLTGTPGAFTAATREDQYLYGGVAAATGKFTVQGLTPGYYAIGYEGSANYDDGFIGGVDALHARVFTVVAGKTVSAGTFIAPAVVATGGIEGTVTGPGGAPLEIDNLYSVEVTRVDGGSYGGYADLLERPEYLNGGHASLRDTPDYSIGSLAPGDYRVTVDTYDLPVRTHMPYSTIVTVTSGYVHLDFELDQFTPLGFDLLPSISSSAPQVGVATLVNAGSTNLPSAVHYQWYRQVDGYAPKPIRGATGSSYTPTPTDWQKQIFVKVTRTKAYDNLLIDSISTIVVPGSFSSTVIGAAQPVNYAAPSITPNTGIRPGTVLRATGGEWSSPGLAFEYQWYANGEPIGATGYTYTATAADAEYEKSITVGVTARLDSAPASEEAVSAEVGVGLSAAPLVKTSPVVTKKGTTYTVTAGTWNVTGLTLGYEWYLDGTLSSTTKTLVYAGTGSIYAVVVVNKEGYHEGYAELVAQKGLAPTIGVTPVVRNGTTNAGISTQDAPTVVGQQLTVEPATWVYSQAGIGPSALLYQWQTSVNGTTWTSIATAKAASYTPVPADSGKKLRVLVTATSPAFASAVLTAPAGTVTPSTALVDATIDSPAVTGAGTVGTSISVNVPVGYAVTGLVYSYQWQKATGFDAPWTNIAGAKAKTYLVAAADNGGFLRALITVSKAGFASDVVESDFKYANKNIAVLTYGAVSPSGDQRPGATLTATPGTFNVAGVTITYQWYASATDDDYIAIPGATAKTYTTTLAQADHRVKAVVTASKAGFTPRSTELDFVALGDLEIRSKTSTTVTPAGIAKVGVTLTATPATWDVASPTLAYQWYSFDGPIAGATAKTWKATADLVGNYVWVSVTAAKPGYITSGSEASSNVRIVSASLGAAPGLPAFGFGSTAKVGTPLSPPSTNVYDLFEYSDELLPAAVSYQWYLGATPIAGATASTYTPKATDLGKTVKLKVTATSAYYPTATYTSPATTVILADAATGTPSITAPGQKPGSKLTVVTGPLSIAGATVTYAWQRAGYDQPYVTIPGATAAAYTLTAADAGLWVRALVTVKKAGYTTAVLESADEIEVYFTDALAWYTQPALGGATVVGGTMTVVPGVLSATGASLTYQWLANGSPIPGATAATFVPAATFFNQALSVRITAARAGYAPVAATTVERVLFRGTAPLVVTGKAPKVTGALNSCSVLTVSTGTWTRGGLAFGYEWLRNGVPIAGATASSYTVTTADDGTTISVRVSATGLGFETGYLTVAAGAIPTNSCPIVT